MFELLPISALIPLICLPLLVIPLLVVIGPALLRPLRIWGLALSLMRLLFLLIHLRGGGALDDVQGIVAGKCVVVLTSSEASSSLCCAPIGATGKLACFKPVGECLTASHAANREYNREAIGPGIYLIAPGPPGRVFCDPVGEVELMESHHAAILDCDESRAT